MYVRTTKGEQLVSFWKLCQTNLLSSFARGYQLPKKKALAHYIYTSKQKQQSTWPSSIEEDQYFEEIVQKMTTLRSSYQTMSYNAEDLYSQPHQFFKWLFYLQQKIHEKVYIIEKYQPPLLPRRMFTGR